jgi:hypothetical protein
VDSCARGVGDGLLQKLFSCFDALIQLIVVKKLHELVESSLEIVRHVGSPGPFEQWCHLFVERTDIPRDKTRHVGIDDVDDGDADEEDEPEFEK